MAAHTPVLATASARNGTPLAPTAASAGGANPERANDSSILVVEYRFEFALEISAEMTTTFIAPAAYGIPMAVNARTNGLPVTPPPPSASSRHGVIISITAIAAT